MAKLIVIDNELAKLLVVLVFATLMAWASAQPSSSWAKTVDSGDKERTTTLEFYFHDTVSGKTPTVVKVAQANQTSTSPTGFGYLAMADDPLTTGPDPKSKLVGRAQGLYGSACQDELGLVMVLSYNFIDGAYNGSSVSVLGRNSAMNPVREMPVVGGTGVFRMARGYAQARTYWMDLRTGDAIVGYNVTVVHY